MANEDATLKISLQPAAFQQGLRSVVDATRNAGQAMGRALKEPINAGLKSAKNEIGSMFSDVKDGLKTIGTLGGALAIGSFVKDAIQLQQAYGNMAAQVNKVAGNAETWQSMQQMIQAEVERTGQKAEVLGEAFMEVFRETASIEDSRKAIAAIGAAATATGQDVHQLAAATQIAMTKFGIKTPEEALARVIEGTGVGGKQLDQLSGSFEMLGEAAAAAGHTGGGTMTMLLNMITTMGDKAEPGLNAMFQTMKQGSGRVLALQKEMGNTVKFTADMTAMDRVRATFMSDKGRKAAEKIFKADARVVYDKLAEPFDQAYKEAKEKGLSNAESVKAGLAAFDEYIQRASTSTQQFATIQETAAKRMKEDPAKKLDMAVEKIRLAFTNPRALAALDKLADKLPVFAETVVKVIDYVVSNPWESLATVVSGKLALAFGGSLIQEAVASGMSALLARAAAIQVASTAASVATQGATTLGVSGAIGAGAAGAGGTAAVIGTGALVAGAALAAGAVGYGAGSLLYNKAGIRSGQEGEFEAIQRAQMAVGDSSRARTPQQIQKALSEIEAAKKNLDDKKSVTNTVVGFLARPFTTTGNPRERAEHDLEKEQKRLTESLRVLRNGVDQVTEATKRSNQTSTRGPLRTPDPNPGSRSFGG